jgi:hypothetical protein
MERGISGQCPAGLRAQLATAVVSNATLSILLASSQSD